MSEQNTDVPIDWSKETDVAKVESPEDVQAAAKDCQVAIFAKLLEDYASAQPVDEKNKPVGTKIGIDFIKDGVSECEDPAQKAAKNALIHDFEKKNLTVEQEEKPAADKQEAAEEVVAPVKETAPVATSAADSKEIADLTKEFRAVVARLETLERRVIDDAAEIEKLKHGRQEDQKALEANIQGEARLIGDVHERLGKLETAAGEAKAAKNRINTFRPGP